MKRKQLAASLLALGERVEALSFRPPRIVRVVVDADGMARRAFDRHGALSPQELAAVGLPRRAAPGHFRDDTGQPREATDAERAAHVASADRLAGRISAAGGRP